MAHGVHRYQRHRPEQSHQRPGGHRDDCMDAGGRATHGAAAEDTHPPECQGLRRHPEAAREPGAAANRMVRCTLSRKHHTGRLLVEAPGRLPPSRLAAVGKARGTTDTGHVFPGRFAKSCTVPCRCHGEGGGVWIGVRIVLQERVVYSSYTLPAMISARRILPLRSSPIQPRKGRNRCRRTGWSDLKIMSYFFHGTWGDR
jgi:hypothetical protein